MEYSNDKRMDGESPADSLLDGLFEDDEYRPRRPLMSDARQASATVGNSMNCAQDSRQCGFKQPSLENVPLAMVYSPEQVWGELYELERGFSRGTIFASLDFPFNGTSCSCRRSREVCDKR